MLTTAADVLFVALVCLATALPAGHLAASTRGWMPGGEEGEPEPEGDEQQ